ncbi:MAG: hypothetical protein SPL08_02340 [Pseudomonadota bacterium]|nr:hypothetical protein [Pseudomonadota bacterium]
MKGKISRLVLKILVGGIVVFLVAVAVKDWAPNQRTVEKTVVYGNK